MSLTLTLTSAPEVPLEAEALSPERFEGMSAAQAAAVAVLHGNRRAQIGDFFRVDGKGNGELRVVGDCARVKRIGAAMTRGSLVIEGNAGMHLGAGMSGGSIVVKGNAGDSAGVEMLGGLIVVMGNAGHLVGSTIRGGSVGVRGGEIIVHGNVGNETGSNMRRGLIAVGGDAGDFTGVDMLAGNVVVLSQLGWRSGAGMKRGTIVSTRPADMLPTFSYACTYRPVMLRLVLAHLRNRGLLVTGAHVTGRYRRWSGDSVEMNRGEILLLEQDGQAGGSDSKPA
jgi:formylmethanofuran dehydrogenase subunit C